MKHGSQIFDRRLIVTTSKVQILPWRSLGTFGLIGSSETDQNQAAKVRDVVI